MIDKARVKYDNIWPTLDLCDSDLELRARDFAFVRHREIDHLRKFTGDPYIVHPQNCVRLLKQFVSDRCTPEMAAALWMHDLLEDTRTTYAELESEFGTVTADLVLDVTNITNPEDGNRAYRMDLERRKLALLDYPSATIKLCDICDNVAGLLTVVDQFVPIYLREKALALKVLEQGDWRLRSILQRMLDDYFALPAPFVALRACSAHSNSHAVLPRPVSRNSPPRPHSSRNRTHAA